MWRPGTDRPDRQCLANEDCACTWEEVNKKSSREDGGKDARHLQHKRPSLKLMT